MKILAVLSVVVVAVTATYSGGPEPTICAAGTSCVHTSICVDGIIDTSGAGGFDLRTNIVSDTCDGAGVVCCSEPGNIGDTYYDYSADYPGDITGDYPGDITGDYPGDITGDYPGDNPADYPGDSPGDNTGDEYYQCHAHEDCVSSELCHDGVIVTDGGGLFDLRTLFKRKCDVGSKCCRRPDAPVPVNACPDKQICTGYDYCSIDGHAVEDIKFGRIYEGQLCYLNPGVSKTTGVCCGAPEEILACPANEQCSPSSLCGADGVISETDVPSSEEYPGQECYLHSTNIGTCCKQPKPVEECPPDGSICTSRDHCNAKGQLVRAGGVSVCSDCQICPVGIGSDAVGVCCGPPAPLPDCPAQTACTSLEYCDNEGYVVSKPSSTPYKTGQECTLPGGYGGYGVCCKTDRPIETYCPIHSECIVKDFCYGNILEADTTDSWSSYGSGKTYHTCSQPDSPEGGICCKNTPANKCGVSYYANNQVNTRFYTPKLDKLEADFGEMPWQGIVFLSNYTFKCGASLISDRHLLTVAHCVNGFFPHDLKIRLGEWQVNTFAEPLQYQDVDVSAIHIHPEFKLKNVWNNLAILELKHPVNLAFNINSVCLPGDGYAFPPGTKCLVGGWGKDSFVGSYQNILKKIDVPLVLHDQCQNLLRKTRLGKYFKLDKSYLCAGGEEGKDACVGDGGGPLICFNEQTQSYTQVGITAWGIGCGTKDVPGAYTDVAHFMPWITSHISKIY